MTKKNFVFGSVFILIMTMHALSFAAGSDPMSIAIEFQSNSMFSGVIGKAYVTETTIEIVTFAEQDGKIIPFAWLYKITTRDSRVKGIYRLSCINQLGVTASGSINGQDWQHPKISLTTDTGILITNITDRGMQMKNKFFPKVYLGD